MPTKEREYARKWYEKNKAKVAQQGREYYAANIERVKDRQRALRQSYKEKVLSIKRERGCADCGVKDVRILEFHHVDPRTKTNSIASMNSSSMEKVLEEINKCVVLCANCHSIREWQRALSEGRLSLHG